jgi:two-component system, sensor histidine kinase YesM
MRKIHILKWLNNVNIRKKLIYSYILVVLLPVLLIGLVLTFSMQKMVTERAMYEANNSVERVYARLKEPLKLAQDLFGQLSADANLEDLVLTRYQTVEEVVDAYSRYFGITNSLGSHVKEIQDIKLYTDNKTMLNSGQFIIIDDDISGTPWFKRVRSLNGGLYWQMVYNSRKDTSYLSLTARIKGPIQ